MPTLEGALAPAAMGSGLLFLLAAARVLAAGLGRFGLDLGRRAVGLRGAVALLLLLLAAGAVARVALLRIAGLGGLVLLAFAAGVVADDRALGFARAVVHFVGRAGAGFGVAVVGVQQADAGRGLDEVGAGQGIRAGDQQLGCQGQMGTVHE